MHCPDRRDTQIMETQSPKFQKERHCSLGAIGVIKSAAEIPLKNPSFITLTIFISLPLFCATLGHELFIQKEPVTYKGLFDLVQALYHYFATQMLFRLVAVKLIEANLLYIVFFDLLNLIVAATTVYSASVLYTNGGKSTEIKTMLPKSISKMRIQGPVSAFLYKSLWSCIFWVAISSWVAAGPALMNKNLFSGVMWVIVLCTASAKWLEYTVKWNIGVIVSILEDIKSGFMTRSEHLIEGNKRHGLILMFLYFVWWSSSIISTQNVKGSFIERLGCALVQSSLLCAGKVMFWLVSMVYYYDCRRCHGEVMI